MTEKKNSAEKKKRGRKSDYKEEYSDQVLKLCLLGATNKEIAEKLYLSTRTVEGHRLKIQEKMQAKNTAGIVIMALKLGIYHQD